MDDPAVGPALDRVVGEGSTPERLRAAALVVRSAVLGMPRGRPSQARAQRGPTPPSKKAPSMSLGWRFEE